MMKKMDKQMDVMKDMHQKMSATTTDAERQTLMKEHFKVMHESMQMMNQQGNVNMRCMGDGKTSSKNHQQIMEKHQAMMQSMMQMMNDHMGTMPKP